MTEIKLSERDAVKVKNAIIIIPPAVCLCASLKRECFYCYQKDAESIIEQAIKEAKERGYESV